MKFDYDDQDWIEISIEEFHRMIEDQDEIEIDLDDFVAYMDELSRENTECEEIEYETQELVSNMREALSVENYHEAYEKAIELRRYNYSRFREEIEKCFEECAKHDVLEALIYEADKYTKRGDGRVKPEAFQYLTKLDRKGYVASFRWLADCFYYGIGCERDVKQADRLYFEGMLFEKSEYCRKKYSGMHPELDEYEGSNLLKNLIKCISSGNGWYDDYERIKIAELILEGMIKEYRPESAYILLRNVKYSYDGYSTYLLGECVLNGIGTEADPIVAKQLFEFAIDDLDWIIGDLEGEWAKETMEESYHSAKDYEEAYESARVLLIEAEERIKRADFVDMLVEHDGLVDEDQIYDEWHEKKPLFIKRAVVNE